MSIRKIRRIGWQVWLFAGLLAAQFLATAPSAEAAARTVTLRNVATGFCLDSNTARNVYTHVCNGGSFQKWTLGPGTTLRNVATGFCLDSNTAKRVYTHVCNGGSFQKWTLR